MVALRAAASALLCLFSVARSSQSLHCIDDYAEHTEQGESRVKKSPILWRHNLHDGCMSQDAIGCPSKSCLIELDISDPAMSMVAIQESVRGQSKFSAFSH